MIKKKLFLLLTAAGTVFASCVDSSYKLSDLDTTVGISVNNLTLPLNVDSLVLDQVLDLDDDGKVKRDTLESGDIIYAIIEEGSFESDAIEIPAFETESPEIEPITSVLTRDKSANIRRRKGGIEKDGVTSANYPINVTDFTKFETTGEVDPSITAIDKIGVNADFGAVINVSENPDLVEKINYISFEDLKMNVPKGLEGTFLVSMGKEEKNITKCYDNVTGVLDLGKYKEEYGEELQIKVENTLSELKFNAHVDAIDVTKAGDDIKLENGEFRLTSSVSVAGDIVVYGEDVNDGFTLDDLPDFINYECTPTLSEIVVSEFTGKIKYDIEDINIDPISLNDIPDMLSQDSTNVKLANPQIYIRLNNPLAANNLYAEAGLAMVAKRNDGSEKIVSLGEDKLKMADDYNVFCLTTDGNMPQEKLHSQYKDAVNKKFNGFSDILSGNGANGLPDKIEIDVVEPMIPEQSIKGFELGQTIEKVQGTYLFYAPLALKDETSFVIYQDTLDGWYDETLEKLSIKKLAVKADVNSEIPLKVELSFHPMDVNGKIIKGVRSSSVTLDATDASQRVEIAMEGNIEKLDGIIVRAKLCGADGEPIAPSQAINFKNLKIAVDGSYIDEF
ncbi:MAG: hypothetical protein IKU50_07260 [Bacteroidaceae bacterium]|nr:hypothetical protein [Bacteroidaceae bacterium]